MEIKWQVIYSISVDAASICLRFPVEPLRVLEVKQRREFSAQVATLHYFPATQFNNKNNFLLAREPSDFLPFIMHLHNKMWRISSFERKTKITPRCYYFDNIMNSKVELRRGQLRGKFNWKSFNCNSAIGSEGDVIDMEKRKLENIMHMYMKLY